MQVIKRNGKSETVKFDKITARLQKLRYNLHESVDVIDVAQKVIQGIYDGITTTELDNLAAETAASLTTTHPDYSLLASRICVSNLHKNTNKNFSKTIKALYNNINAKTGLPAPLIADDVLKIIEDNADELDSAINYDRDFLFDYFGYKTLEKSYLLKINGKIVERPQHMYMRVAIGIHKEDIQKAIETYNSMSLHFYTHASPTLFNAGTPKPQMSSCFLLANKGDSIEGIFSTVKDVANISKWAGGIGLHVHDIRANGSYIKGTSGHSTGLVPWLKIYNETARAVNQGGKRKGAFAIYLEPHHPDIFEFLDLRKNHGKEEMRARDLFYGLWISDLFMQRVEDNADWSLFCPDECPGLSDVYGEDYNKLYSYYEISGKAARTVKAQDLWFAILNAQIETGNPYILYKDSCNSKSNQKNLGTIKSSNLCTEIIEYSSPTETAVCNLASISLPKFVINSKFDFEELGRIAYEITINLNKVIDNNFYPTEETKVSNFKHRPIGIGVQGLADVYMVLRIPFDSEGAKQLNKDIFETMYFAAMTASKDLAIKDGAFSSFSGSPLSSGLFQFDLWNQKPSDRYDWQKLREEILCHGVRNSLLVAPMPTASTSQILGNNECFEPYTSNIYTRRVLSGEFIVVNKHLVKHLIELGLWSKEMKNKIIEANGSIQYINEIPANAKAIYKTVWEIKQRDLIDMSADRGIYICQSQSLNLFMDSPTLSKLTSMHFYSWKKGLKTGMYYLRTKAAAQAIQFTVEKTAENASEMVSEGAVCTMEDGCISCGS